MPLRMCMCYSARVVSGVLLLYGIGTAVALSSLANTRYFANVAYLVSVMSDATN